MIGYVPTEAELAARRIFGIPLPDDEPAAPPRHEVLGISEEEYPALREAAQAFASLSGAPIEARVRAAEHDLLMFAEIVRTARALDDLLDQLAAPARRSRMHAAYRTKTRRRNRR